VVIAAWPAPREAHWAALLVARAIENQAYVVGVNRCGDDPRNHYSGRSMIVDPQGRILAEAYESDGIRVSVVVPHSAARGLRKYLLHQEDETQLPRR
jgi:omega-amidase